MTRCNNCKKRIGFLGLTCTYCEKYLCINCIQLEVHECIGIQESIERSKEALEKSLKHTESINTNIEYDSGNAY